MGGFFDDKAQQMLDDGSYDKAMKFLNKLRSKQQDNWTRIQYTPDVNRRIKRERETSRARHKLDWQTGEHIAKK